MPTYFSARYAHKLLSLLATIGEDSPSIRYYAEGTDSCSEFLARELQETMDTYRKGKGQEEADPNANTTVRRRII
jgi:hypothetical protein